MNLYNDASLIITPNGVKAGKLYALKGDDLNVVRATSATRVNASGLIELVGANVLRLDYTNGSCPSILVEQQRTNITLQSQDLSSTWYTAGGLLDSNITTSPDGTNTADKIKADNTNSIHVYQQTINVLNATEYTMSVFVKSSEYTFFELADASNLKAQTFNLTSKTISAPQTGGFTPATSSKIEDYGNGWLRCSITYTTSSTTAFFRISLSNGTTTSFAGNNTNGLFVWGAQLEAGSYATSYIPTTSASVTRNADVISKTGISSLIGQTEGTMFFDLNLNSRISYNYIFLLTNFSKYISIFITNNTIRLEIVNSSTQVSIDFSNTNNGRFKIGVGYANNNVIYYVNGTLIGSDNSCTIPDTNQIDLTYNSANSIEYKTVALWKTRLTNSQIAELTTI